MSVEAPLTWSLLWRSQASRGFVVLWLATALVGITLARQPAHEFADVTHYKLWARLVTIQGVTASYSGEYPETYAIYPPVLMYALAAIGHAYQMLVDPSFDRDAALASHRLTVMIRLLALGMHLVLGAVLFALVGRWAGPRRGLIGSGLYLLNPGALWDVAVWGQPDPWHSLFGLLGIWFAGRGRGASAGGWLGLAAMTKPQAWALLPLAGTALLRSGTRVSVRAAVAGASVIAAVLLPFLASGHLREFLTLPGHISSVMPVASANAHNLWWLVTRGEFPFVLDNAHVLDRLPLSYRQASLLLFAFVFLFVVWRAWKARGPWDLATLSAYLVHAWFFVTSQAHENHAFMLFPFLCLVWWRSRFLLAILVVLIALFTFNVLAHDFGLEPLVAETLGPWSWRLQMLASALNLTILLAWTAWLLRPLAPRSDPTPPAEP